ncbi:hypothetical protein N7474_008547 [Penicillium riverlandense]|uniref:uncharacterized protein n=1 Tax=Penicillium riverlandense TaxID=1903569 RepID=UPI002548937F|nr:uncharacterized protein N7474_008547 [Penicillium riverlandense]KAJ5812246.1 hypothetical protein N7474_008547 [Penicillium riverlandense]
MKSSIAPLSLISLALCATSSASVLPTRTLQRRADFCGQYDSTTTGSYSVNNNLWGLSEDENGTQCTGVDSLSGSTIAWHTTFSWSGDTTQVKSYADVALQFSAQQLSAISSIESSWDWSYSTTDITADVSYDMFLSSSATGSNEYEIMVWLAAIGGAGPISSTGSPIATATINGITWNLYYGMNGSTYVYSFVANSEVTSFSGDMLQFFQYLEEYEGVSSSLYLITVQSGTEPFSGTAELTTSAYSVVVS